MTKPNVNKEIKSVVDKFVEERSAEFKHLKENSQFLTMIEAKQSEKKEIYIPSIVFDSIIMKYANRSILRK